MMTAATKPNLPNYASTTDMGTGPNLGPSLGNQTSTIGVALPGDQMAAGTSCAPTHWLKDLYRLHSVNPQPLRYLLLPHAVLLADHDRDWR